MTPAISVAGLIRRYRGQLALDRVSFDVAGGSITGLLGRNGAGKTTLLRILAGQEFPSAGSVRVLDASPAENDQILRRMVFIREDQAYPDVKVRHVLRAASWFYPNWSAELADRLLAGFGLPRDRPVKKLSRGMRSALGIVIGLAARAEVTLFDEPYAGLDAVARQRFYDWLLAVTLAAAVGLALTVLQAIERATGGWGVAMHFFRVPYILDGPWYLTWLTSFVALALLFVYGMWFGIVYRRWNLAGPVTFIAAQVTVLLAVALLITWIHAWPGTGRFFTALSAAGLTGLLAVLAAALLAGGYATIRRATI